MQSAASSPPPRVAVKPLEFHPKAVIEGEDAAAWYAERDLQVALLFAEELSATFERIAEAPDRWPRYLHETRRVLLLKFPYFVIYRDEEARVVIVAIVHVSRDPGYWRSR